MKNKVVTALACVGLVVAVGAALRVWEDHTAWGREELRRGYSQTARTLMPWFRQFLYTLVFLAGGASLSALFARGRRLAALKPWLAGAVLLFMIAGVAVTSTFRLRVLWVQRDPHAAFTQRQAPVTCQLRWPEEIPRVPRRRTSVVEGEEAEALAARREPRAPNARRAEAAGRLVAGADRRVAS